MNTEKILKKIKATDIKTYFDQNTFCGKVSFKINGVSFEGRFDIDNVGLYAIQLKSGLNELGKLTEITNNKADNSAENSDLSKSSPSYVTHPEEIPLPEKHLLSDHTPLFHPNT